MLDTFSFITEIVEQNSSLKSLKNALLKQLKISAFWKNDYV